MQVAEMCMLRYLSRVSQKDRIRNGCIRVVDIADKAAKYRPLWLAMG